MPSVTVQHKASDGRGMFYVPGERPGQDFRAAMMYHHYGEDDGTINVDHTEVDESLRGQGVGKQLLESLTAWAAGEGDVKVSATCPFAVAQLKKDSALGRGVVVEYTEGRTR